VSFLLLLLAAALGGVANALAGGGTFIVFPALLFAGVASVKANATASLISVPGAIVSAWVYRGTLSGQRPALIAQLVAASIAGSAVGSILLLRTPNGTFSNLVPWLLLLAAAVFTLAPRLRSAAARASGHQSLTALLIGQFVIAVYGGYFGAGMGVLMIALYLLAANMGVQAGNGIRLVCGSAINVLAVALFGARGALDWKFGLPMLIAGIAGGYFGARILRGLNEKAARNAILIYSWGLTAYFFARMVWNGTQNV
jgi:uncharacterized membrane protein YfcA